MSKIGKRGLTGRAPQILKWKMRRAFVFESTPPDRRRFFAPQGFESAFLRAEII
jgi:hypothetical protein